MRHKSLRSTFAQIESNNISIVSTDYVIEQCKILNKNEMMNCFFAFLSWEYPEKYFICQMFQLCYEKNFSPSHKNVYSFH